MRMIVRMFAATALVAAVLAGQSGAAEPARAEASIKWGVNGHPFTAYPGVTFAEQAKLLQRLGARSYRVDVSSLNHLEPMATLKQALDSAGIDMLPVLNPPVSLKDDDADALRQKSRAFAEIVVRRFPDIPVWELGNELENFAIIQPCEMRDDGTKYPCEWGPAGGVGELDYYGPRYRKVAAVLTGLAEGVAAVNPQAKRAIGTAGWGHTGVFARLAKDGVPWEVSVWHWYDNDPEWAFKILASHGKPIWVTEFNHPYGSQRDGEEAQAKGLAEKMATLQRLAARYRIEAAHVYELFDERYWEPSFEAHMGLVRLAREGEKGWQAGDDKPAFGSFRAAARSTRSLAQPQPVDEADSPGQ